MKSVVFTKMVVEGFGSLAKRTEFTLDRPGVNIIRGKNGAGKSTLFNALYWCLYGTTSKNVSVKEIPTFIEYQPKTFKGTYVILHMTVDGNEYTVIRTYNSKHDFKELLVGNSDLVVFSHVESRNIAMDLDKQEVLTTLIGMDDTMFANSVFFGQKTERLMDAKEKDKRAIFETILSSVIEDMENLKEKMTYERGKKSSELSQIEVKEGKLQGQQLAIEQDITRIGEDIRNAHQILQQKTSQIELEMSAQDDVLVELRKSLPKIKDRATEAVRVATEIKTKIKAIDGKYDIKKLEEEYINTLAYKKTLERDLDDSGDVELREIEYGPGSRCGTCGSIITEQTLERVRAENIHRRNLANTRRTSLTQSLNRVREKLEKFEALAKVKKVRSDFVEKYQDLKREVDQCKRDMEYTQKQIQNTEHTLRTLEVRKAELKDTTEYLENNLKERHAQLKKINASLSKMAGSKESIQERINYLDWWCRIGLGARGINTYLYESLLISFNEALQKYATILGMGVKLIIDNTKVSRPFLLECYDGTVVKSYGALSGGEQQRVNIGILFALYELIGSKSVSTNILLLDEVFEGLDEMGTTMVFQVLQMYADRSVYVITHNEDVSADYAEFIDFDKLNGQTVWQ